MRKLAACVVAFGLGLATQGCGGGGSAANPTSPTRQAVVTGTMTVTTESSSAGGINYVGVITLRETGGLAATISNTVTVQLMKNGTPYLSPQLLNNAWPLNPSSNTLPANGSLHSNPLYFWDQAPSGVPTQMDARVDFVDLSSNTGSLHVTADVAAMTSAPSAEVLLTGR
jgi:hypothetical protein